MTVQADTAKPTAVIFASTDVEAKAVLSRLHWRADEGFPFRVGEYGDWRVAVMNLEDCDENTGLVEESFTQSLSGSLSGPLGGSLTGPLTVSERGAVSVTRLLEMAQNAFAPELALFVGIARLLRRSCRPGDVVIADPFVWGVRKNIVVSPEVAARYSRLMENRPWITFGPVASSTYKATTSCIARDEPGIALAEFRVRGSAPPAALLRGVCAADGGEKERAVVSVADAALAVLEGPESDPIIAVAEYLRMLEPQEIESIAATALSALLGVTFKLGLNGLLQAETKGGKVAVDLFASHFGMTQAPNLHSMTRDIPDLRLYIAANVGHISLSKEQAAAIVAQPGIDLAYLEFDNSPAPPFAALLVAAQREVELLQPDLRPILHRLSRLPEMPEAIERLRETLTVTGGDDLAELRSHLLDLTPSDFERASAAALSGILGIPFRQASSGRQPSGDAGGGPVRLEAKRYRDSIPKSRDLLGGLATMCQAVPDLSHWVVASTTEFPLQAADELRADAEKRLVREVILDWPAASIPPLAGALVAGREEVGRNFPTLAPILTHLAEDPDVVKAGEDVRAALRAEPPGRPIYDPVLHYVDGKVSGGASLNPAYRLVPFMNRDQELADVVRWAMQGNQPAYLLTGGGGMGKTRLMIEACVALRAEGCRAGFLRPKCDFKALRTQLSGSDRFLIVVDYAERRGDDIKDMCRLIAEMQATDRIRLALLARNGGVWHDKLLDDHHARAFLDAMVERELEPAAPRKADHAREDRRQVLEKAVRAFASCREGKDVDAIMTALHGRIDFDREEYNTILDLLMEAWVPVFGSGSSVNPMDEIVRWERRYLGGLAPDPLTADTMMEVLGWVYANEGTATRKDAIALLTQCPSLGGLSAPLVAKIAEVFHNCYGGPLWLNPIQPDRVGHAVQQKYGP